MSGNLLQTTGASVADFSMFKVVGALEKPCLGRPFKLGMLYDCRSDALIPDVTLWGSEALTTALSKKPFETSDFEIIADDSLSEKLTYLGVDSSLKLSIMSGLVQVEGAAKFFYDQKSSKKQARVSLKYKSTTRFEQLIMDQLGNGEYTDVFEKDIATHVVIGMVYGADAFFVFDQEIGENEDMRNIHGSLMVKVGGLPGLQKLAIGGEGFSDANTGVKENKEQLYCKFYGDLILPKYPATFRDAAMVYQELPELLQGKSVPKMVCLYPLGKLDSKAERMVYQISSRLVDELYTLMEYLHDIIVQGNDLIKSEVCSNFVGLKDDLESMKDLISGYRADLKKNLATLVPKIRGGGTDETKVAEILEKNSLSPFNRQGLSSWISGKEHEVKILAGYLKHLKEQEVIQLVFKPGEVDVIVNDLDIETVLCFDFGIACGQDVLLLKMKEYLRNGEVCQGDSTPQLWYRNQALMREMRQWFRCFKSFAIANHRREATKFIVTNSDSKKAAFVSLYESGCESKFEAPDKPGKPQASNISHTGLQLNWEIPKYSANVQSYTVCYTDNESSGQWCTQTASGAEQQLVLSELVPGTAYFFKVRAETNAGCSPDSDVCMTRLPPSAPDKPHASNITHNSLQLNWNKPSHGSETVQSYTIFYCKSNSDDWNSYKPANQQEHVQLSDLVPKTVYVFKVRAESAAGSGPDSELSDPIKTLLPISEPGKPTLERVTHNSIKLKWDKPEWGADIVEHYFILYRRSVDDPDADSSWHTNKTSDPHETAKLSDLVPQTAYVFKVRAESTAGASQDSDPSDPIETLSPISQPGKPTATRVTHNSITLKWNKPELGADIVEHYAIFYRLSVDDPDADSSWHTHKTSDPFETAQLSDLASQTAYVFKVRAESATGASPDSELSDPIETLLPISEPGKPTATRMTHNSITLKWNKPEQGADIVEHYAIFYRLSVDDPDADSSWHTHKTSDPLKTAQLSDLASQTAYVFKVRAESATGASPDSELSDPIETLLPISEPGKPTATRVTHDSITLKWNKPELGADIVEHYAIFYRLSVDDPDADSSWHTHKTSDPFETAQLSDLASQTAYVFKVRAESATGASPDSELSDPIETLLPISEPGKPTATRMTHNSITLKWNKPEQGADIVEHYAIFYRLSVDDPDADSSWHTHKTSDPFETAQLSDLASQTAYVFKVRAESATGASPDSELSDPIETLLPISEPGKPTATRVTHNSIILKWNKPEQGADIVEHYDIFYRLSVDDPDADSSWHTHKTSDPLETVQLSDLASQTVYVFKVRAESATGASPDSELSDPIETLLPISEPGKPTATRVTHNSITLKWNKPEQGADLVEHYTILYRCSVDDSDADSSWYADCKTVKALETVSNLVPQTAYVFKVRAESTTGTSQDSEISDSIETSPLISQPGKPRDSKVSHNYITLKWDKPERGANKVEHYTIFYQRSDDGPADNSWCTQKTSNPLETAQVSDLVPQTTYIFKVRAESTAGASPDSKISDPIETHLPISQPGKPKQSKVSHDYITLKWDKPERGADKVEHYTIFYRCSVNDPDVWNHYKTPNRNVTTTVVNLEPKMSYIFKVRAESATATSPESESSDQIETLSPISQPGKPSLVNATHNSITLQWSKSDRGAMSVQYYTILYRRYADDTDNWTPIQTCNSQRNATLSDLDPKTAYVFKLRAESSAGPSPYSELSEPIETLLPISQPGKPIATDVTHNCITLRWLKPEHGSHNVQHYKVFCKDNHSDDFKQLTINAILAPHNLEEILKLSKFVPNTEYFFKVRAESNTWVSPESELSDPVRTLMPVSEPGKPFATKVTHDCVTLKWERPKQGAQYLKHYQVTYYSTDNPDRIASCTAKAEEITLLKLDPESAYIFKVKAETVAGSISESEISDPIKTLLSPPGKPYATNITYKGFRVNWQKPSYGPILYYSLSYQATNDPPDMWHTQKTIGDITHLSFSAAKGNFHVFKVTAVTSAGASSDSELSDPIETLVEPWGVTLYRSLNPIPNSNPPTCLLPTHCVMRKADIVKVHVGANSQDKTKKGVHTSCSCHTRTAGVRHKVLMVVGATGAGKTTLINGIANYIMGVQWDDDFRFKLIAESTSQDQSKSQTMCITAYTFYKESGSNLPYTLTVIDTPGFGDTGGLKRDKYIVSQIKELFSIAGDEGIDQLHGIGFVTQAPLARLTPTQQYVFDAILSVFGKDVADNIFLMITFADGMKPPVLDAVKAAGVPNKAFFKFNNSALFASKSADDEFDRMFWKMGTKSFDEFFKQFSSAQAQSLQLSKEVIQERETLEVTIQGLQPQIQAGLSKIDELRQERQMLKDHEADILTNKNFTYRVEVTKQRKIDLPQGIYTTNCLTCNYTCHNNCAYADDDDKYKCSAMRSDRGTPNAVCGSCPQKCSWKMHKNNPYRFELYQDYETRTSDELKTRYESAITSKEQLEGVIKDMKKELDTMNMAVLRKMEQARRSVQRLQEIALRPNYLTEVEYIDLIIETEKREAKPRWLDRVKALEGVRQQAKIVTELMKNPQAQQQCVFSFEETAQEKSMWQKFLYWYRT